MQFCPMNAYHRCIIHKLAVHYSLDHFVINGSVRVVKTPKASM
jgi:hypothetical protein